MAELTVWAKTTVEKENHHNRNLGFFRNFIAAIVALFALIWTLSSFAQTNEGAPPLLPIADAGSDRTLTLQTPLLLDGTNSISPNKTRLEYSWSLIQQPAGSLAVLNDANGPRPNLVPDLAGDYVAELVVTDDQGNRSAAQTVLLTTGNIPPVAMAGDDREGLVGQSLRLDPDGTYDANGDRLSATWSILSFQAPTSDADPVDAANNNLVCPADTVESIGTFHVVSATSFQQNPHLAVGPPLPEGTTETGNNSAITYYGPITMDLTGDDSVFVPEGEVIEIVLSSAWGTSARAEILMSADGINYTSLGTTGNGGTVYGAFSSNILRYDDFTVPAGGARFLQVSHQNSGVRADGVIYNTQCQSSGLSSAPDEDPDLNEFASLVEDEGGRFVFTPNEPGEYSIELLVEDEEGARSTDIVEIYVASLDGDDPSINFAPVANAGVSQLTTVGEAVTLDSTGSTDVNGNRLTYEWSILSKPADSFSLIENASSPIATIWPDTDRTYVLQLKVTDSLGLTDYDTVVLDGKLIRPFAANGPDGAITNQSALVSATNSLGETGSNLNLAYNWSVLGLADGVSEVEDATSVSTQIDFSSGNDDEPQNSEAQAAVDLLGEYNLIVFEDMDSGVDTRGRTLVGGNLFGNSAIFGTQIPQGQNIDALSVVGNISGGPKNINNGGNVRLGGTVSTHLNLNGGGQLINDTGLSVTIEQSSLLSLSSNLAGFPENSTAQIPSPNGQHGPGRLNASPDENGIAVFNIPDGNLLFSNDRVQQIEVNANGAETIIVNIGGADIDFNRGNFVGAINNDHLRRKVIWNFHEATDLYFERAFNGTLLAPKAHLFNRSDIRGAVVVESLQARGPIALPGFSGTGLAFEQEEVVTNFALVQLEVRDVENPKLAPSYSSFSLSTANLRPVAIAQTSNGDNNVTPGTEVTLISASSLDGNNDQLSYGWSILSAPTGSEVEIENAATPTISISPDTSGHYVFQLSVSDGQLMSRLATVSFNVMNTAPIADAGEAQEVSKGELVQLSALNSSDFDGDELSYVWGFSEKPNGSTAELANSDTATPSFEADLGGTYVVSLVVSDGFVDSEVDSVVIEAVNGLPIADISGPDSGVIEDLITLSAIGSSDPDADSLTFLWTLQGPAESTASLSNVTEIMPMFTPDIGGIYIVTLVVNDGQADSNPATININIGDSNRPPVLDSIGNQVVALGSTMSFQVSATDPDGDEVSFGLSPLPLPEGASFNSTTGTFNFTPTSAVSDRFDFNFTVSDGILSDTEVVSVTISDDDEDNSTRIAGRVVDAVTQNPLSGVIVTVGDVTSRTDSDGRFLLNDIEVTESLIWIAVDQLTETDGNGLSYISNQATISLVSGVLNTVQEDFELTSGATIVNVDNSAPIVIEDSGRNIKVEIPTQTIRRVGVESRYWRLLFNEVVSSSDPDRVDIVEINEFILSNDFSEGNLLNGGTAFASSNGSSASSPARGVDGVSTLTWVSSAGDFPGAWLAYDLGEGRSAFAERLEIRSGRSFLSSPFRSPIDFDLQISENGIDWTTVRNFTTTPDWAFQETRGFSISPTFQDDLSVSRISPAQAAQMPVGTSVCDMFTLGPKGISFVNPIEVSIRNVDELPIGTPVEVLVFTKDGFQPRGTGIVSENGETITATVRALQGGDIFAFAPMASANSIAIDQPETTYIPSLLNEGNYSMARQLPGYRSNGASRGLSFVYNSTAANPTPIVAADVRLGAAIPQAVNSFVEVGGVTYTADDQISLSGETLQTGDILRQAVQLNANNLPTGSNTYKFISVSDHGCAKVASVSEGNLFVDNQSESPFGRGWSLAELSRIYPQENGSVLIREGNGTLKNFPAQTDFSTLGEPVRLPLLGPYRGRAFDLDGDGDQDILWIAPEQSGIVIYENAGDETFINRGVLQAGGFVDVPEQGPFGPDLTGVAVGDIDGDGALDIVTGSQRGDGVFAFYGTLSDFSFTEAEEISSRDVRDIEVADVDADGRDDVIIMSATAIFTTEAFMISVTPDREPIQQLFVGLRLRNFIGIDIQDINDDGIPDVLGRGRSLGVWLGRPGDVPIEAVDISGQFANQLGDYEGFVDLNNDGQYEILASGREGTLAVYERQSNGRYDLLETLEIPVANSEQSEFSVADINGNGLEDIIVASGQSLVTFFNLEDGLVSEAEVVDVGFDVDSIRIADFNDDGSVDVVVDSSQTDELFIYYSDSSRTSRFIDPLTDYTVLTRNEDGSFNRRYNDGTVIVYAANGLQSSMTDSNGNITAYEYDSQERLISITDPVGLVTNFNYGTNDRLSSINYPDGRSAQWTYNSRGDLIRSVDVNGDISIFGYDEVGRLTAATDPRGLQTEVEYDAAGRYAGSTLPDGTNLRLELARTLGLPELGGGEFVAGSGGITSVTDGRGNVTETLINDFGSPLRVTDPLGRVTVYERDANNNVIVIDAPSSVTGDKRLRTEIDYDSRGNVIAKREAVGTNLEREMTYAYEPVFNKMISMVDYDGFESTYTYDAFGNRITETDPLGGIITMTYDAAGLPTSHTDKNGNLTTYSYNLLGLLASTEDASGTRQLFEYDEQGNMLRQIDDVSGILQREMSYTYDEKNRKISMTEADGGVMTYVYDGNDNLISTTDPTDIVETRSYDDRDRLETINDPASGTTTFVYDEDSNVLRMTDALGDTTEYSYDAVDRLLSSIDARGQLRAFAYDLRDNITAVTDARANITHMGYDVLDRPIARTNPKGEQWNFAYDLRDNRTSATKPDGVVLLSDYDGLSRLIRIAGGDIERTYGYDPQSNLLAANDNLNGVAGPDLGFTYDQENRLGSASVTNLFGNGAQNNVFTYVYDALDRRASMADSFDGNTAYAYDPVDRLTRVTTPQGEVFTTNYDLAGRMLGRAAPNATATARSYEDETGRLSTQTHAASDTAFNGFTYDYTARGNIAEIAETGELARTKRYSYDELERLTEVEVPEAPTEDESYTLDPEGNRLSSHLSDTGETDVANRLSGDDAYSYVYDLNGNLISKTAKSGVSRPDWTYDYDDLDQLISVSRNGVEVERYRYDAFGRRSVIDTANDNAVFERTGIVNDGDYRTIDLVVEDDGVTAQIQNRYTHGGQVDEPLSFEVFASDGTFDQAYTYHADHLGSIRFVTDGLGNIANAYEYDSYGRPGFELEVVAQPFRYTGREWDAATELYHYRARQYDPETGRFLQEDPIGFAAGDLNLQRYVWNNPLTYTDPSGLSAAETVGTSGSAVGSAVAIANIGFRLNCIFTAISHAVDIAGSPDLEILDVIIAGGETALACGVKVKPKAPKGKDKICPLTCFAAGTKVHSREGLKNIEDILPGDEVKSMDPISGEISYKRVLNTHVNRFDPTGVVSLIDDSDGSTTNLSVTAEHPFYHTTKGWVHASKLSVGDHLSEDDGGIIRVTEVIFNPDAPINTTYNLEIADFHTYFVGEDGVLVHNAKKRDLKFFDAAFRSACRKTGRTPTEDLQDFVHDRITRQFDPNIKFDDFVKEIVTLIRR